MKKFLIFLLVLAIVAGVALTIYNNRTNVIVRNSVMGALGGFLDRDELSPIVNMLGKGSLELRAEAEGEATSLIFGNSIDRINAGGKIYFSDDALMLKDFGFECGDVSLSGSAYIGEDLMYVENKDILGGSWGAVRGEMSGSFEDSMFVEWFKLSDNAVELVELLLKDYDNGRDLDLIKDLEKYLKKYTITVVRAFEKYADYESEIDTVRVGGDKISARVIDVTVDADAIVNILEYTYDKFRADDKLHDLITDYIWDYEKYLRDFGVLDEYGSIHEWYYRTIDSLGEYIDMLASTADDADGEIVFRIVTSKMSAKLLQFSMIEREDEDEDDTIFTLDFGTKGVKKSDRISVTIADNLAYTYRVKENNSKEYTSELKMEYIDDDYSVTLFKLSIDRKDDTFKLVSGDMTLSGDFVEKGKTTTVRFNKIKMGDETIKGFEITLIVKEKDKMPKPVNKNSVNNIFDLTEEDIAEMEDKGGVLLGNGMLGGEIEESPDYGFDNNNGTAQMPNIDFSGSNGYVTDDREAPNVSGNNNSAFNEVTPSFRVP